MKRFALSLVYLLLAAGCGASTADFFDNDVAESEAGLSATSRSFVVLRRDVRRCAAPYCGGFYVRDVNRKTLREVYVRELDFSATALTPQQQNVALGGKDGEVVLFGKLGKVDAATRTRAFLVSQAWRGLPGVSVTRSDTFYSVDSKAAVVRCIAAPCMSETAKSLNSTSQSVFSSYAFQRALKPHVDELWARDRVMNEGALVAGTLRNGAQLPAGRDRVLDVKQVFLKVPESQADLCPPIRPAPCTNAQEEIVYERTPDRCAMPVGCVVPGACIQMIPVCERGYTLSSWKEAPHACPAYACDPDFSL